MRRLAFGLLLASLLVAGCGGSGATTSSEDDGTGEDSPEYTGPRGWDRSTARNPGETSETPFEDPTEAAAPGGREARTYERPYSRDSLKDTPALIVSNRTDTPFPDPGVLPISGNPQLTDDGEMVRIPAGTFIMGLTDADPFDIQNAGRKRVSLSSFYLDRFEVTNAEYRAFLDSTTGPSDASRRPDSTAWRPDETRLAWNQYFYDGQYADNPVVAITWDDARAYCRWAGKRLPTEAEWEYAARAGRVGGIYPWAGFQPQSSDGSYLANYNPGRRGKASDGYAFTAPVGSYPPSSWGLHDMAGNVAEWTADAYASTYRDHSDFNPYHRDPDEPKRMVRGGSWSSDAFRIGVGLRDFQNRNEASTRIGVRCAVDVARYDEAQARRSGTP
jgi:formylglycine-generating enzyme required for sulfatase activity